MKFAIDLVVRLIENLIANPERTIITVALLIAVLFVKPVHTFFASLWSSIKLLFKPSGFITWLVLGLVTFILLKVYGVI